MARVPSEPGADRVAGRDAEPGAGPGAGSSGDPGADPAVDPAVDPGADTARRLAAWRRTGDLAALWPGVTAEARARAHADIRRVTAAVLASALQDPPSSPSPPPALAAGEPEAVRALGVAAFLSGMGPLLGWWIERGRIEASDPVRDLFAEHLEHNRRRAALLAERTLRVAAAMQVEGVRPILLKGLHTGSVYMPEPGTRPAADIDLLVRPADRSRAAAALARAGFTEVRRTRYAARSEWMPTGASGTVHSLELDHADDPYAIDLHTRLERWYFRGLRRDLGDRVFERTSPVRLAAAGAEHPPLHGLAQPYLAAFLALHAGYVPGRLRLVGLVELALVLRRDASVGAPVWDELTELVRRTGTGRFVHPALALVEELVPGTVEPGLLLELERRATPRTLRVLDELRAGDFAPLTRPSMDAKLMWARGPREWLLNLSELVVPSDDGLSMGIVRLQWRRLRALVSGRAAWRARRRPDSLDP